MGLPKGQHPAHVLTKADRSRGGQNFRKRAPVCKLTRWYPTHVKNHVDRNVFDPGCLHCRTDSLQSS